MNRKGLMKDGIAIGFGFFVGKGLANIVLNISGKTLLHIMDECMKNEAEKGSETAKAFCDKYKIKYKVKEETEKKED